VWKVWLLATVNGEADFGRDMNDAIGNDRLNVSTVHHWDEVTADMMTNSVLPLV
jgi:hypothetical protein